MYWVVQKWVGEIWDGEYLTGEWVDIFYARTEGGAIRQHSRETRHHDPLVAAMRYRIESRSITTKTA